MTQLAPGARAQIRDEEWLIRRVGSSANGDRTRSCDGILGLVRGQSALSLTALEDDIEIFAPALQTLQQHRARTLIADSVVLCKTLQVGIVATGLIQ